MFAKILNFGTVLSFHKQLNVYTCVELASEIVNMPSINYEKRGPGISGKNLHKPRLRQMKSLGGTRNVDESG